MSGEPKTLTPQKCVWKRDPDGDSYVWVIGCTNEFSIQPDAEDYGYCPRCGQGIKLVTAPLEDHEGRWPEVSGEPKTLTLTLEEAMCRLYNEGWNLVAVPAWRRATAHSWELESKTDWREGFATWPEAVSFALGVPVVARDEAAELRAALDAARDAMVSALAYHHHSLSNPVKEELNAAINRAGRALAGGESER